MLVDLGVSMQTYPLPLGPRRYLVDKPLESKQIEGSNKKPKSIGIIKGLLGG